MSKKAWIQDKKLQEAANRVAELHRMRLAAFEADRREYQRKIVDQAAVHSVEITAYAVLLRDREELLRTAIGMIKALQRREWTPADGTQLAELVETCKLAGVGKKCAGRLLDGREWNEYP